MYYCSRECQKEDFPKHKRVCRKIERLVNTLEGEDIHLRNHKLYGNVFENCAGHFWSFPNTCGYMRARLLLANEIHDNIALEYETKNSWDDVVEHYQELMRLCEGDILGLRFRFPFLLLHLNHDDDAFDFCRYWCIEVDPEEREVLHQNSQEGDWMYGHEEDCRYLDIFEECPNDLPRYMPLPLLVAVAVIKMRIVATHDARKESLELFQMTATGEKLSPVQSVMTSILEGDDTFRAKMETQRAQLNLLLDQIHLCNPTMLPALLNPDPLLEQVDPGYHNNGQPPEAYPGGYHIYGQPLEAYYILENALFLWRNIPGSKELLESRFGRNPTYNTNILLHNEDPNED
jgi:hypothetical protein